MREQPGEQRPVHRAGSAASAPRAAASRARPAPRRCRGPCTTAAAERGRPATRGSAGSAGTPAAHPAERVAGSARAAARAGRSTGRGRTGSRWPGRGSARAAGRPRCCLSTGRSRGSWIDSAAAMTSTSRRTLLLRLEHHATEPRVEGQPREPASGLGERSRRLPGWSAPSSRSSATPSEMLRASGGSTNGKPAISPRPSAAICRITDARLVRRISGSVNSGRASKSLLGVEPDADAVGDAAAPAGRWFADACEIGSIGRRCTLSRGSSARCARCRGRRRSGCPARSATSRRRWSPARPDGRSAARTRGAARRRTAARRAARSRCRAASARAARRRCRGSRARRTGRRARRPAPRAAARRRRRRSPAPGRARRRPSSAPTSGR